MKERYINIENNSNTTFFFDTNPKKNIFCGKLIIPSPANEKDSPVHHILKNKLHIHFIFDDDIPEINFFPIPSLAVFATNNKGIFASSNLDVDLNEKNAPIFFIDLNRKSFLIAMNLRELFAKLIYHPEELKERWDFSLLDQTEYHLLASALGIDNNFSIKKNNPDLFQVTLYESLEDASTLYKIE